MREILRDIAPLLGVLLTAVAAIFAYRSAERQRSQAPPENKSAGMVAVGGAIASAENTRLYIEEFQRLIHAIDRLTEQQAKAADAWDEARGAHFKTLRAAEEIASALVQIARIMKQRE